ncbi:MAG: hypothetical protein KF688_01535 [Pirellulales bacterium]|nr:hypothetical protein [Pirellulales bacterium]
MGLITRVLFPFIAYLCVGTVVTAALAYSYLAKSGRLDDETKFRIAALLHGVDLDKIQQELDKEATPVVPEEEPSYEQKQKQLDAAALHFDAMRKQLESSLTQFDYQLARLTIATREYSLLKDEVNQFLQQQNSLVADQAMQRVKEQIEGFSAKKQAKPILKKYIDDKRIDEVIVILNLLKKRSREEVLKAFDQPEDLDQLYQVQRAMLSNDPTKVFIDEKIEALKALKDQEK